MPNNVESCRQSAMQGVSSAVQLDSDGQMMVCLIERWEFPFSAAKSPQSEEIPDNSRCYRVTCFTVTSNHVKRIL